MHPIKYMLIKRNGTYCMLCGKHCEYPDLEWHHIKPKWLCMKQSGRIDNSYSNGLLLCTSCHKYVHTFSYYSEEYHTLMVSAENHKAP